AFERSGVVHRVAGVARPGRLLPVVLVEPLERRRAHLAAHELVHRRQQQARVVRELLAVGRAPAGEDDGGEIVGAEVPLEEAVQRLLDARAARQVHVQVVEHEQVDAAVHADVGIHVGLDGGRREQRTLGARDRNVDVGERAHHLRLAVLEHLEIGGAQIGDRLAGGVADEGVDLDEVRLDAEGQRRLRRLRVGGRGGCRLLRRGSQSSGETRRQDYGGQKSPCHTRIMLPNRRTGRCVIGGRGQEAGLLPPAPCDLMLTVYSDVMPLDVAAIQETLRSDGLDGWLLYDFHGSNPIAARLAGLTNGAHMTTRRWYYLIPALGSPRALVHAIERHNLDALPGTKQSYAGREELAKGLDALLRGVRRVAMEYSPQAAIPYLSRVDAGTAEMIRARGVEIVSSGDLVQRFEAAWTPAQLATHVRASDALYRIKDRAFDRARRALAQRERVTEFDLQQEMVGWFEEERLVSDSAPVVAVGRNAGNPHYLPSRDHSADIAPEQILLLDLWGKVTDPGAVFADITWVGFTGPRAPDEASRAFDAIARARDAAVALVEEAALTGRELHGWEVDRAARAVLEQSGYGSHLLHRTGHSLGE